MHGHNAGLHAGWLLFLLKLQHVHCVCAVLVYMGYDGVTHWLAEWNVSGHRLWPAEFGHGDNCAPVSGSCDGHSV
jgi:hypothetical protein